jgi:predicted O-methyltransferase YrrM
MLKRTPSVMLALRVADIVIALFAMLSAVWLKVIRVAGLQNMPVSRRILRGVGVLPVRDHYYEPMIDPRHLRLPLEYDRNLPGINLNVTEQLAFLARFSYQNELLAFPMLPTGNEHEFYYHNNSFPSGDAEYYYSVIRLAKPRRITEIGSGFSTLMALNALRRNVDEDPRCACKLVCVELYEQPWLARLAVKLVRRRVEELDVAVFASLDANDILFIDSSHVVRPQGDVLFELLEILPSLRPGVLVHVHDVFTPKAYLRWWIKDEVKLCNEQYVLETFLTCNANFKTIGALNYLQHHHPELLGQKLPVLGCELAAREPGSFWIKRDH